jgi:hypothetical protein
MNIVNTLYPKEGQTVSKRHVHFMSDLLGCIATELDLKEVHAWTVSRSSGSTFETAEGLSQPQGTQVKLHDKYLLSGTSTMDQLEPGTEIIIQQDRHLHINTWWTVAKLLRQWMLPTYHFEGCSVLRGTLGKRVPLTQCDDEAVIIYWDPKD